MTIDPRNLARDANPIELSPTQIDNYLVRPEFFTVRQYDDETSVSGQAKNDPEAEKKSNERNNRGSVRAEGNVNHPGPRPPRWEGV